MAISKRTRFEVLRRDNHTCRYCRATDNPLTIDHVTPVALGGSDAPDNLVACCRDCNAGKSSMSPDSALVADVEQDAFRWAAARKVAAARLEAHRTRHNKALNSFLATWKNWNESGDFLPEDWRESISFWLDQGVTIDQIEDAYFIALGKRHVRAQHVFRYLAGIVKNWLIELDEATRSVLDSEGDDTDG